MKKTPYRKLLLKILPVFLFLSLLSVSCGDEGISFNVRTDFPVDVPILIDVPDAGNTEQIDDLLNVNPPSETFSYNLAEVSAFDDALEGIQGAESIELNGLFYEITGVEENERVDLDQLAIVVQVAGSDLVLLDIRTRLNNFDRTPISLTEEQRSSIVEELRRSNGINAEVIFDLSEIPADNSDITFDYTMYFDVTLKARDL